jgi:Mg2+ and Co2+ transporter CorA
MAVEQELLDKMQRTDHDTLIRVEAKVDGLISEVKNSSTNIGAQLLEHEVRIRSIEKIHDQVDPIGGRAELDSLVLDRSASKAEKRTIAALSAGVGSLVTLIAAAAAAISGFLSLHK